MLRTYLVLTAAASLVAWPAAGAQPRWSAELDGGVGFPTGKLAGADLDTGFGFGANVRYRLQPHLAAYGGWEWHHFRTAALAPAGRVDVEDTGYTFGLRFEHPLGRRVAGWVRAGGLANHIELENDAGDLIGDSGHGLGFELGGGLAVPLGDRLALTPGVRFRSLARDLDVGDARRSARLSYVMVGTGIAFHF